MGGPKLSGCSENMEELKDQKSRTDEQEDDGHLDAAEAYIYFFLRETRKGQETA